MKSIQVIATTFEGTRAAIEMAVPLARGCGSPLVVVVPKVVPYPVPADAPPDTAQLAVEQYQRQIEELGGDGHVRLCLFPTIEDVVAQMIKPDSTVVVGGASGRWRMSPEERFANRLSREGYRVVFAATGRASTRRRIPFPAAATFLVVLACAASSGVAHRGPDPNAAAATLVTRWWSLL